MGDVELNCLDESDPIRQFLLHKLEEVRSTNADLEKQLSNRRRMLEDCASSTAAKFRGDFIAVTDTWNYTFNDRWIAGIALQAKDPHTLISEVQPVFQWECPKPLTYTTRLFNRYKRKSHKPVINNNLTDLSKSLSAKCRSVLPVEGEWYAWDSFSGSGILIATFDIPQFNDTNVHKMSGIVKYRQAGRQYHLELSDFELNIADLLSGAKELVLAGLLAGDERGYLSLLASNDKSCYTVKVPPHSKIDLERRLEFECGFFKVSSVVSSMEVFLVDGVSAMINGSIVQILEDAADMIYTMIIYSGDNFGLQLLLHHLHQHISKILIVPLDYTSQVDEILRNMGEYNSQVRNDENLGREKSLRRLGDSLDAQMDLAEEFCAKRWEGMVESEALDVTADAGDYKEFRRTLSRLELQSDECYDEATRNADVADLVLAL